jgi:hypothetical protein
MTLGMPVADYGMFGMPQNAKGTGTNGGGRVSVFRPDATDAQVEAGMKWLEFHNYNRYMSEENAVAWAQARQAENLPVPEVGLPAVSGDVYSQFMGWIEPYINVPLSQIQNYLDSADTLLIQPEPPYATGDLFQIMDTVIQGVMGDENADIPALLQTAQDTADPIWKADRDAQQS